LRAATLTSGGTGTGALLPATAATEIAVGFHGRWRLRFRELLFGGRPGDGDLAGGFSHSNVPFDFIPGSPGQTSGIEAEHGGSLGACQRHHEEGSNNFHGSVFGQFEKSGMDGSPVAFQRYDPSSLPAPFRALSTTSTRVTSSTAD